MIDPTAPGDDVTEFLIERHLATLTLAGPDGVLHTSAVGFSWDGVEALARVITFSGARKARLLESHGELVASLCQIDGGRWLALHGTATVSADPAVNADAEQRYAARYRPPGDRGDERRTIIVSVDRIVGRT